MAQYLDPDKINRSLIKKILIFFGLYENPFKNNLRKRYSFCNKYVKDKNVLDIPCGMGWGTSILKKYNKVYGVDKNKKAIIKARYKYQDKNRKFIIGNMVDYSKRFSSRSFDVVICLEGLEHITYLEGQKFFKETKKVLKQNGILILSTPLLIRNKFHSGNQYHLNEYKKEELLSVVKKFKFLVIKRKTIKNPNGSKTILLVLKND